MNMESYLHRHAKAVMVQWLRDWAAKADDDGYQTDAFRRWSPFSWRVNRGGPHYGIWEEWPVCRDFGVAAVWDESAWAWDLNQIPMPYATSDELTEEDKACQRLVDTRPPTYEECLKLGLPPTVILDIAIQHKGMLSIGIEIVNKNDISPQKLEHLQELAPYGVEIYRIPARWIMGQIGMPRTLVCDRVL